MKLNTAVCATLHACACCQLLKGPCEQLGCYLPPNCRDGAIGDVLPGCANLQPTNVSLFVNLSFTTNGGDPRKSANCGSTEWGGVGHPLWTFSSCFVSFPMKISSSGNMCVDKAPESTSARTHFNTAGISQASFTSVRDRWGSQNLCLFIPTFHTMDACSGRVCLLLITLVPHICPALH